MSADDLDSFFAKKDKKKKTKSKFTPEELLEQQNDGDKKKKKKSKPKEAADTEKSQSSSSFLMENDEDWIEFEGEKEVDYSGLKIANLQISKDNEDDNVNEEEEEYDEEGERKVREESGPWKPVAAAPPPPQPARAPTPEPVPEEKPVDDQPKKYVPPAARRAAQLASQTPPAQTRLRKKKVAPDVGNEMEFPSLGATPTAADRNMDRELLSGGRFEQVRGGGTREIEHSSSGQKLELVQNRFATSDN